MKLKVFIHVDNAAFEDNPDELADILRSLADRVDGAHLDTDIAGLLRDSNGNKVGSYEMVD